MRSRTQKLDARHVAPLIMLAFAGGVPLVTLADEIKKDDEAAAAAPADKPAEVPQVKWINVANEGEFAGHPDGEFALDRKTFEGFVAELHRDPRYKAGEDGVGITKTIPFDFEHASEMDPREGSIAQNGAPAPAWVLDLQVRDAEDGTAQLWALAWLGSKIREYIKNEEYRHVSIAFSLQAKDPKSAEVIGPRISSIAFTNHPFLRDTVPLPIAANRRGVRGASESVILNSWYDTAGSVEQGLEYTRRCLGLGPTADVTVIKGEISKLAAFASSPETIPPGVDLDDIFESLRKIWGLPVTSTVPEIVAQLDTASAQMAVATAAASNANAAVANAAAAAPLVPPANQLSSQPADSAAPPQENSVMGLSATNVAIVKCLRANKYRTERMLADDADVEGAVEDMAKDVAKLNAVLSALGVDNAEAALAAIPSLKNALSQLSSVQAQLTEALQMQAAAEEGAASADVAAAASSKGLNGADEALTIQRQAMINDATAAAETAAKAQGRNASPKELFDARHGARRKFLSSYGVAPDNQERLLKNIAAVSNGGAGSSPLTVPETTALRGTTGGGSLGGTRTQINLSGLAGRNTFERLCSWVKTQPNKDKLNHHDLCREASLISNARDKYEIVDPAKASAA